ncbi:hypothetical protein HDU97_004195 [Phlyctochytrium planicorne]|nr:hypothetical protein HDU97_004195 [Phlyctochytrium planicorne]
MTLTSHRNANLENLLSVSTVADLVAGFLHASDAFSDDPEQWSSPLASLARLSACSKKLRDLRRFLFRDLCLPRHVNSRRWTTGQEDSLERLVESLKEDAGMCRSVSVVAVHVLRDEGATLYVPFVVKEVLKLVSLAARQVTLRIFCLRPQEIPSSDVLSTSERLVELFDETVLRWHRLVDFRFVFLEPALDHREKIAALRPELGNAYVQSGMGQPVYWWVEALRRGLDGVLGDVGRRPALDVRFPASHTLGVGVSRLLGDLTMERRVAEMVLAYFKGEAGVGAGLRARLRVPLGARPTGVVVGDILEAVGKGDGVCSVGGIDFGIGVGERYCCWWEAGRHVAGIVMGAVKSFGEQHVRCVSNSGGAVCCCHQCPAAVAEPPLFSYQKRRRKTPQTVLMFADPKRGRGGRFLRLGEEERLEISGRIVIDLGLLLPIRSEGRKDVDWEGAGVVYAGWIKVLGTLIKGQGVAVVCSADNDCEATGFELDENHLNPMSESAFEAFVDFLRELLGRSDVGIPVTGNVDISDPRDSMVDLFRRGLGTAIRMGVKVAEK